MPSFTPDTELDLLFPSELISSEVKAQLGTDLHVNVHLVVTYFTFEQHHR